MRPHRLTNFEIQKYYKNEPRYNGVFSRNNLPKKKDGAYIINLDQYANVSTHWIASFCNKNEIKTNIFCIQENNSIMCGYFCIGFIDLMLAGKKLTDYTSLFSPYDFKKNDSIILSYFKNELKIIH